MLPASSTLPAAAWGPECAGAGSRAGLLHCQASADGKTPAGMHAPPPPIPHAYTHAPHSSPLHPGLLPSPPQYPHAHTPPQPPPPLWDDLGASPHLLCPVPLLVSLSPHPSPPFPAPLLTFVLSHFPPAALGASKCDGPWGGRGALSQARPATSPRPLWPREPTAPGQAWPDFVAAEPLFKSYETPNRTDNTLSTLLIKLLPEVKTMIVGLSFPTLRPVQEG